MPLDVHNVEAGKPAGVCEYIGRTSPLGNPFVIGRDGTRADVILKYRKWLWAKVRSKEAPVFQKLLNLAARSKEETIHLLCHCKPQACHGDVIVACVEWMRQNLKF